MLSFPGYRSSFSGDMEAALSGDLYSPPIPPSRAVTDPVPDLQPGDSLSEILVFLVTLIRRFEFPPGNPPRIKRVHDILISLVVVRRRRKRVSYHSKSLFSITSDGILILWAIYSVPAFLLGTSVPRRTLLDTVWYALLKVPRRSAL